MDKKITTWQFAALLFMSNIFAESMNFPTDISKFESNRFLTLALIYLGSFLVFIPLIIISVKNPGFSAYQVLCGKNKPLAVIFGFLIVAKLLCSGVITACRLQFFVTTTILPQIPCVSFMVALFALILYGVYMGMARGGFCTYGKIAQVFLTVFVLMSVVVSIATFDKMEILFLPPFNEPVRDTAVNTVTAIAKSSEFFLFAVLGGYACRQPHKSVLFYLPVTLLILEFMSAVIRLVVGPYYNHISFPFYMVTSLSDVVLFERLDGLDVILWIVSGAVRIIVGILCINTVLRHMFGTAGKQKDTVPGGAKRILSAVIPTAVTGVLAVLVSGKSQVSEHSGLMSSIVMVTVVLAVIIMPILAMLIKGKEDGANEKEAEQA